MTVTCSRCVNLPGAGRQPKEFTKLGLYRCSKSPAWVFRSPVATRECEMFAPVPAKDLPAREKFEASQGGLPSMQRAV